MKILLCFGTRPEAIKMAPIIFELRRRNISFKVCVTAQHREMLDQVLDIFKIRPAYDLDLMVPGQSINGLSGRILLEIDKILQIEKPDIVLVHGDTSSSITIALAAFNNKIPVGHVEAGLRTYKEAPFPEEMNRQLTSRIAAFHFCPTTSAAANLRREGIAKDKIFITGNTVVDAIKWMESRLQEDSIKKELPTHFLDSIDSRKLILVTGHRRENFGNGILNVCDSLLELTQREEVNVVFPVHPNPEVHSSVYKLLKNKSNIHLIPPVSYPTLLWLIKKADLIISDSGGIQEEAPSFRKPLLVTREYSERMEGIDNGFAILVGCDRNKIVKEARRILGMPPNLSGKENPYGDGRAAEKIIDILETLNTKS